MQRRHHYEAAFEQYLRERRVPYVAVDEARKALLPEDARLLVTDPALGQRSLKSFDFVLYGRDANLLVEIKGRRIARRRRPRTPDREITRPAGRPPAPARLENWVTEEDVESLSTWERLFGEGFAAAFVFVYWCDELPGGALFEEIFEFHGRWYALRAVALAEYGAHMRPRSQKWRTVHVPPAVFDRISTALVGGEGGPPERTEGDLLFPGRSLPRRRALVGSDS